RGHRGPAVLAPGTLDPPERSRISAPGHDVEYRGAEIDAMNLGLAVRSQPIAGIPEAPHRTRTESSGASRALIGRIGGDPFDLEAVDRALGIVASHLVQ